MRWLAILLYALLPTVTTQAHRLDECLQGTLISIAPDQIRLELNLTPGVEVAPAFLALMDTNKDGAISEAEGKAYAGRLTKDLSLSLDDKPLKLRIAGSWFSPVAEIREGVGRIRLELTFKVSSVKPGPHHLDFQNIHQSALSQYLVNALLPANETIQIEKQTRDERQQNVRIEFRMGSALK